MLQSGRSAALKPVIVIPPMLRGFFISVLLVIVTVHLRAEVPSGAIVLDSSIVWDPVCADSFAISPDGKWIAYVSKGAIWICSVTAGPPKKLVDLPDTITDFLSRPENQEPGRSSRTLRPIQGTNHCPIFEGRFNNSSVSVGRRSKTV